MSDPRYFEPFVLYALQKRCLDTLSTTPSLIQGVARAMRRRDNVLLATFGGHAVRSFVYSRTDPDQIVQSAKVLHQHISRLHHWHEGAPCHWADAKYSDNPVLTHDFVLESLARELLDTTRVRLVLGRFPFDGRNASLLRPHLAALGIPDAAIDPWLDMLAERFDAGLPAEPGNDFLDEVVALTAYEVARTAATLRYLAAAVRWHLGLGDGVVPPQMIPPRMTRSGNRELRVPPLVPVVAGGACAALARTGCVAREPVPPQRE